MFFQKHSIAVAAALVAGVPLSAHAAPSVSWSAPNNGATIAGTISGSACAANVTSSVAMSRVVFWANSMQINNDYSSPWNCSFDTKKLSDGTYTLKAVAYDVNGASSTSQVSVTIKNSGSTTPPPPPPPTNTAPSVSLSSPASGQTVSGTIALSAIAADDKAVSRVVFSVDSTTLATDTASPFSASLNTTTLANGTHTLKAQAFDAEGLSATSQVSVNVQNGTTTPPTTPAGSPPALSVSWSAPANGATISGTISGSACAANVTSSVAMNRVTFWADGMQVNNDYSSPFNCTFDSKKLKDGAHTLKAVAYDSNGASSTSQISVTIQNSASTTPPPPPPPTGSVMPTDSANVRGVATFHSIGMYWASPGASSSGCRMQFRKQGDGAWRDAMDMWFDGRNSECRGSIVQLQPGTQYEVQMGLPGQSFKKGLAVATWSESFPIAQTITLPASSSSTLNITSGGSAGGYVLYQAGSGGSTIDVANGKPNNIVISAPYVIVRGLTLKGAQQDAILIANGAHDVVIENNDISNWGRLNYTNSSGWQVGVDMDSGIRCKNASAFERGTVQRNRIHDPRYGANSWDWGHPTGPQGITYSFCGGNHVIRYNEIYSTTGQQHYYNDGIGGEDNFSATGFPNYDTDIYGNRISETWDDAIEAEGGNKNVRVFGNYTNNTNTGVASTVVNSGPLYVFRNVHNRSRAYSLKALDQDDRNNAYKSGEAGGFGGGRRYVLHNTLLQATGSGATRGLGMGGGLAGNTGQPLTNTVSRNNIFHVWVANAYSVYSAGGGGNDADYDLRNGAVNISGAEVNGLVGTPTYASGNGWQSEAGGNYQLSASSAGYGRGLRLPNFNDAYLAPDMGAHQSGAGSMSFGVAGNASFWVSGAPVGGTTSTSTASTSTTTTTSTSPSTTAVLGPVAVPQ